MLTPPAALEAVLFASGLPMEKKALAKLMGISDKELQLTLDALDAGLKGRGLVLLDAGTEVELRTAPAAAAIIKKMRESELARDLGKASIETLAVIAYGAGSTRHPTNQVGGVTRGEIEWVRGVNSSASLRTLLMRGLVEGREDPSDKRRIRYSLTTEALAHLGLSSPAGLPRYAELSAGRAAVLKEEGSEAS